MPRTVDEQAVVCRRKIVRVKKNYVAGTLNPSASHNSEMIPYALRSARHRASFDTPTKRDVMIQLTHSC